MVASLAADRHDPFPGDSKMARRMRQLDWSRTNVGSPEKWPWHLRTALSLCLSSRFPTIVYWGPSLSVLYNDACIPLLGPGRHPRVLGRPGRECWGEVWDRIAPLLEGVMRTGEATASVDEEYFFHRSLPLEEVYLTCSYGPMLSPEGSRVDGVFCACAETTGSVVGARRLETLRMLGAGSGKGKSVPSVCRETVAALRKNPRDVPLAAIYVVNRRGTRARLSAAVGPSERFRLPYEFDLENTSGTRWPLAAVLEDRSSRLVSLEEVGVRLAGGAWPEPVREAMVLPIPTSSGGGVNGLLVLGVGQRRVLDADYRTFFELVAHRLGAALDEARADDIERWRAQTLAEIDRAKAALLINVSHGFRTPLTLMLGPLEDSLADARDPLSESHRERLMTAHRNSLRLLKLVDTLLDFSRIEAGRIPISHEPVDLGQLTGDLARRFRPACERAGITLRVFCPPAAREAEPLYVDRGMWEKIVLNLLSNALKFTLEGSISVSLMRRKGGASLVVSDTGSGIPAASLPHLFERFYRVPESRGRTSEGLGIGLALVKELVQLHGGRVHAHSSLGDGSTFTVTIPAGSSHLAQGQIASPRVQTSTVRDGTSVEEALHSLADGDVLPGETKRREPDGAIVDTADQPRARIIWTADNPDMRAYVERLLDSRYDVDTVEDGLSALEAIRRRPPDLVLSDAMMPGLDGPELVRQLRADPRTREIPVIMLAARPGEESRVTGLETGAADHLTKPFSARELLARVANHLELARIRREAQQRVLHVLDSITEGFEIIDADWRTVYINPAGRQLFLSRGLDPDWMIGKNLWNEIFPRDHNGTVARHLKQAMQQRIPLMFEMHYERWDAWYLNRVDPLPDGGLAHYFRDITAEKKIEAQLVATSERLARDLAVMQRLHQVSTRLVSAGQGASLLLEILDAAIGVTGADMGIIQLLDPASGTFSIAAHHGFDDSLLEHFRDVTDAGACGGDMRAGHQIIVHDVMATRVLDEPSREILRRSGVQALHSTPLVTRSGSLLGMLSTHYRTTRGPADGDLRLLDLLARQAADWVERNHADEALRDSEARYRSLTAQVKDYAIFSTDPNGKVSTWNEGCQHVLGYGQEEFLGLDSAELFSDEHQAGRVLQQALDEGTARLNRWMNAKDKQRFYAMGAVTCLSDAASRLIGFSFVLRDITEMKRSQDELAHHGEALAYELERTAERLRLSERMASLGTLSAGLGHDLGNLLLPIDIRLKLLLDSDLTAELRDHVVGIEKGTQYLQRLASGLRSLAVDPEASLDEAVTELRSWWEEAATVFRNVLPRGIKLDAELPENDCWVGMKLVTLTQVVFNLVQNAADAMRERENGLVLVSVVDNPEEAWVYLRVTDDGPGMAPDVVRRCMEPYFTTKPRGMSTGMGLSFVHRFVAEVGGQVDIASIVEHGTTVTLTLPRATVLSSV